MAQGQAEQATESLIAQLRQEIQRVDQADELRAFRTPGQRPGYMPMEPMPSAEDMKRMAGDGTAKTWATQRLADIQRKCIEFSRKYIKTFKVKCYL